MDTTKIGNTPLQLCPYLSEKYACSIFIKKEFYNINKTSKDRPAWYMIQQAIELGLLQQGDTLVEASSGNTGIGLAQFAQQLGYGCRIYVSKDCAREKLSLLRRLGATVIACDNSNGLSDKGSTQYQASVYAQSTPNCYFTDQYNNPQNPLSHYQTTGPEIWEQTNGKLTHFFAGIGTGGTISGTGKYLKTKNHNIQICGIEPNGSILSHLKSHGSLPKALPTMEKIDGIGRRFVPTVFAPEVIDEIFQVSRTESISWANTYYEEEEILLGFSSAAVLSGLERYAEKHPIHADDRIVLLFADYGDRYLNSLYPTFKKELAQYDEKF
ncbi:MULTISPECIES: PLP-dependent cysteine synthase family protein [Sphingobacterium]|uniref:PLP-dependent cysteine synthase family protein n=1 Tax=Sphingobacterium TaxID=28453 RepID=UPI0013DCDBC2|nr:MULTISPECIES: cysteine synthase family protein [unclassified Sphingobacterium]